MRNAEKDASSARWGVVENNMNNLRQHYFESRANLPAKIRSALAVLAIAVPMCTALPAQASTFTVGGSGNTFTVSRSGDTSAAETVHYRTVPLSAFPGQHYTEKSGTLVFAPGQTGTNITVTTCTPSNDAYRYQTGGASRSYRFEVTDGSGVFLDRRDASVTSGLTRFYGEKVSKSVANLVTLSGGNFSSGMSSGKYLDVSYTPPSGQVESSGTLSGYVLIDDSYDYAQKPAAVSTANLINSTGATASYLDTLGYKIYATVCFTEKEKDDGYQYLQILAGDGNATYDTGYDPEEAVNDPVNSIYKVCFELSSNSDAEGKAYFPHRGTTSGEFSVSTGKLYQQKYRSGYEGSGAVVLPVTTSYVTTRFDAGGKNDDTWGYKDFFVRMALCDTTPPSRLGDPVLAPGRYGYGNEFYVSVPFGEIVTVSGTPTISSDWGDLSYFSGSGSNVLTFKGTINAAIGTQLYLSTLSGTVTDLAGNAISIPLTINKSFPATVDYPWPGAGTAVDPYVITTTNQLGFLASCVNATYGDIDFAGKFFELGADISYDYQYDWDNIVTKTYTITCETEDNYTAIGGYGRPFKGTFDGRGHTISGVRITKPGSDNYSTSQGLFGYVGDSGTVKNIFLRDAMIYGYNNIGGIAGCNRGVIMGCTVYHVRVFTGQDVTSDFNGKGPITGYNGGTVTGSHYRDCATLKSDGFCYNSYYSDLVTLSTASDVAAEPATVETAIIDGTLYYATGNTFSLFCSIPVPENWCVVYTATGGATVNDATLTLASDDTIVSAAVVPPDDYVAHWQAGSGHDGTSAKPYLITTPDGLQLLSSEVNHGTAFAGTYFQLGNDIDMGAVANFMPIGNEFFPFSGTFDGNGHTISGISISRPNTNYQGLFGFLSNATVMNLTLADSSIEGGESIGGIAGNFDYGSIQNCFVTGTTLSGGNFIGAIAGSCGYDTLSGNAYHGCAAVINGSTSTCNIGIGNTGDSPTRVWPCCTLAFAEGIAPVTAPQFSFPVYGTNNSYYAAGQTVIVRAAAGGYAFANVRVNGIDATDNGDGTFSFTMPAVDATVTADLEALPAIPYIDADGEPQVCADYTVITNAAGNVAYGERGAEAWYVVTNDVTISGRLYFDDDYAHLIICDGATLAVTNEDGIAINSRGLIIYGQANGTGAIVATGISKALYSFYFSGIKSYFVIINSGSVTATGSDYGIYTDISVTINGGSVTATGGGYGIYVRSNITLGWTNPTDSIYANSYYVDNGKVRVKDDQRLTDGNAIYESGPSLDLSDLAGKTLVPAYSITLPAGVVASGVVTQDGTTAYARPGDTVTLRAAAPGYAIGNVTVDGVPLEPVDGIYSFAASAASITVTATTVMTQWEALQMQLDAGGTVTLANDVTAMSIDETLTVTNAVTLDLAGHTIDAAQRFRVIEVSRTGDLMLTNSVPESGAITGGRAGNGGGVYVEEGMFTMNGGAISNNYATSAGGGVYVIGNRSTFTMTGGTISGNGKSPSGNVSDGGGVFVSNGTFTMSGGEISGNAAKRNGGGVFVSNGTFTMSGGEISGNTAKFNGGGVYVNGDTFYDTFTMTGGEISGNVAYANGIDNERGGGGVFVRGGKSGFEMSGGTIISNSVQSLAKAYGGGVLVIGNASSAAALDTCPTNFTMTGGAISGNFATTTSDRNAWVEGGGVFVCNGKFTMSGGEISGNASDKSGGGVALKSTSRFEMSGGTISGNTAKALGEYNNNGGGGVLVAANDSEFMMTGGTISGNAANIGGGVSVYNGAFKVLDSPAITDNTNVIANVVMESNVYLPSGKKIAVSGLTAGARIGVTTETKPTKSLPVTFTNGAAADDEAYFFSDNHRYHVVQGTSGLQLVMAYPTYLEGANNGQKDLYDVWAGLYGEDVDSVYEAAFLLNVAPSATPIELRIAGIEVVEGGARVRVTCRAGLSAEALAAAGLSAEALAAAGASAAAGAVDLSQINGVISVSAGDDLGALAPKAASGIAYSAGEATIFVPTSAGRFVKAVIGLTAPEEE